MANFDHRKPKIQQPGVARDQHNYEYISLPRNNGRTLLAPSASQPDETNTAGPQESHYSLAYADITEPTFVGTGTSTVTNKRLVYFELENPLDKLVAAADDPKTGEDDVQQQSENQAEMKREAEDAEIVLITNKSYCEVNIPAASTHNTDGNVGSTPPPTYWDLEKQNV